MRWQLGTALLSLMLVSAAHAQEAKVIYGADNRQDYYEVTDSFWRNKADSTFALIRAASLTTLGDETKIKTTAYGRSTGLCTSEPYYDQETAAFCSGFLVAPDTLVTAGHCLRTQDSCENTRFVIGFRLETAGMNPRSVPTENVYSCARLVKSVVKSGGEDFAVVKLDRAVTQVAPLPLRLNGDINVGEGLTVIGHPAGLPTKVAGSARVRSVGAEHLTANLDTYGGNSGSAVFNDVTGEVEGILVRGEADYVTENGCRKSKRCTDGGCRGEDVTLISRAIPYLNH